MLGIEALVGGSTAMHNLHRCIHPFRLGMSPNDRRGWVYGKRVYSCQFHLCISPALITGIEDLLCILG